MTVCGHNNVSHIVGGEEATSYSGSWMAAFFELDYSNKSVWCAGTVIDHRNFLSAAHCVFEGRRMLKASDFRIMLGAHNLPAKDGEWYDVKKITVHPEYDTNTFQNDIMLFTLKKRIVFSKTIAPICLAEPSVSTINLTHYHGVITGWGDKMSGSNLGSPVLRQVRLAIVNTPRCIEAYEEENVTELNMLPFSSWIIATKVYDMVINRRYVLSAAHRVFKGRQMLKASDFRIMLGAHNLPARDDHYMKMDGKLPRGKFYLITNISNGLYF